MDEIHIAANDLNTVALSVGKKRIHGCCARHDKFKRITVEILDS